MEAGERETKRLPSAPAATGEEILQYAVRSNRPRRMTVNARRKETKHGEQGEVWAIEGEEISAWGFRSVRQEA